MLLVKSPEMTEENRAAHQANGQQSQGHVTPEGKAHSAAANLRYGFYSTSRAEVLLGLGEQPEEYLGLMKVRKGVLTQKDVKNEGRSGDLYENKGTIDKMS